MDRARRILADGQDRRAVSRALNKRSFELDQPATTSPNVDQITYWNARAGNTWASMRKRLDAQIGSIGLKALEALGHREGERVGDIGCGCRTTSFEIARRLDTCGRVTAIDISRPMLDVPRRDAGAI